MKDLNLFILFLILISCKSSIEEESSSQTKTSFQPTKIEFCVFDKFKVYWSKANTSTARGKLIKDYSNEMGSGYLECSSYGSSTLIWNLIGETIILNKDSGLVNTFAEHFPKGLETKQMHSMALQSHFIKLYEENKLDKRQVDIYMKLAQSFSDNYKVGIERIIETK